MEENELRLFSQFPPSLLGCLWLAASFNNPVLVHDSLFQITAPSLACLGLGVVIELLLLPSVSLFYSV